MKRKIFAFGKTGWKGLYKVEEMKINFAFALNKMNV
jgi:hypothetical protein